MKKKSKTRFVAVSTLVFATLIIFLFAIDRISEFRTIRCENDIPRISDFAYILLMVKAFIFGEIDSIYRHGSQLFVMKNIFNSNSIIAMPLGISPTIILAFFPFVMLSNDFAHTLWISCSLVALAAYVVLALTPVLQKNIKLMPIYAVIVAAVFCSFVMSKAVVLGQTSISACAVMMLIVGKSNQLEKGNWICKSIISVPIVLIMSVKLHYLFLFFYALGIYSMYTMMLISSIVLVVLSVVVVSMFGLQIVEEWLYGLSQFSNVVADSYYQNTIYNAQKSFVSFQGAFAECFGYQESFIISKTLFAILICSAILLAMQPGKKFLQSMGIASRLSPQKLLVIFMGAMFLFMPYMGRYEDILMLPLFASVLLARGQFQPSYVFCFAVVCMVIYFNFEILPFQLPLTALWSLRFLMFLFLYIESGKQDNPVSTSGTLQVEVASCTK